MANYITCFIKLMYRMLVIFSMLLIHKNKTMDKAENQYVCRAWNMRPIMRQHRIS